MASQPDPAEVHGASSVGLKKHRAHTTDDHSTIAQPSSSDSSPRAPVYGSATTTNPKTNETNHSPVHPTQKRKNYDRDASAVDENIPKKAKLANDNHNDEGGDLDAESNTTPDMTQHLPAEVWHHIFTFLPPRTLGNLLLVNKLFHTYLDPASRVKTSSPIFSPSSVLLALKPDAIWQASRRLFWPRMPVPLKGRSEVDMWRLACTRTCQFCRRRDQGEIGPAHPKWHNGPGVNGVSPVFPFFIVSCGRCLGEESIKENDLILSSSTPYFLLSGLPMAILTSEFYIIPPQVIRTGSVPLNVQLSKVFWPEHVEKIKAELGAVAKLGTAAAEEWNKGLEVKGKGILADSSRWEKWYMSGGIQQMRMRDSADLSFHADKTSTATSSAASPANTKDASNTMDKSGAVNEATSKDKYITDVNEQIDAKPRPLSIPPKPPTRSQSQQKRTQEEASELKESRRTEIERRASRLQPPIAPNILAHMPSFQAALQIISPFDDEAWELLRPRLLAQQESAEQRERNSVVNIDAPQDLPRKATVSNQKTKEATEEEWNEVQGPLRARIASFASEIIKDGWDDGKKVKKKNCAQFATDVLLYVRKRFYAEFASDDTTARTAGVAPILDPPEGLWTRKLTLENMKWIFDTKIKPLTDRHRKDLFQCSGCEATRKFFGFEAIIQHYAAKHTNAFSKGTVVVNWRAEWPETPIFNLETRLSIPPTTTTVESREVFMASAPFHANQSVQSSMSSTNGIAFTAKVGQNHAVSQLPNLMSVLYNTEAPTVSFGRPNLSPQNQSTAVPDHKQGSAESLRQSDEDKEEHGAVLSQIYCPHFHARDKPRGGYQQVQPNDHYREKVDLMARIAKDTWHALSRVNNIPSSVKICTVVHHIAKGYQQKYSEPAPFETFIDGLNNHESFIPLRDIQNLTCKACMALPLWSHERGPYNLPGLTGHFYVNHGRALMNQMAPPDDWRVDMIWLPDMGALAGLETVLRNKKQALQLVSDALPWALKNKSEDNSRMAEAKSAAVQTSTGRPVESTAAAPVQASTPAPASQQNQPAKEVLALQDRPLLRPASVVYGKPQYNRHLAGYASLPFTRNGHSTPDINQQEPRSDVRTAGQGYAPGQGLGDAAEQPDSFKEPRRRNLNQMHGAGATSMDDNGRGQGARVVTHAAPIALHPDDGRRLSNAPGFNQGENEVDFDRARQDAARREMVYDSGEIEYVEVRRFGADDRQRSVSPRSVYRYVQPLYRERSPRPSSSRVPYEYEVRYTQYPRHREEPPPIYPPLETYEIVEVRDPQGDYFIRRPIRVEETEVLTYPGRAGDVGWYPRYTTAYEYAPPDRQPSIHAEYRSSRAKSPEFEDYDPRYPATGHTDGSSRHIGRP